MPISPAYIDRDAQRCHDLLNLANLFLAQKEFDKAASVIDDLRTASADLPGWRAQYFQDRLIQFNRQQMRQKAEQTQEMAGVINLDAYRRKNFQRRNLHHITVGGGLTSRPSYNAPQVPAVSEDENGNFIYRMPMPLDEVSHSDSFGMEHLLRLWRTSQQQSKNPLPLLSSINPETFTEIGMLGYVHVIDVSPAGPHDFSVQVYGSRVTLHNGQNLSGMPLGDLPISIYRDAVATDYNTARMTGMPYYHRVVATIDDSRRHYTRLILPFSTDGMRPDRLLVGVRIDNWLVE